MPERQIDVAENPIFYDHTLTAQTYLDWLHARGVGWVALLMPRRGLF
ncbi:MAG: hypothetical protein ACQSGP_14195 [Frankia sp.]